MRHCLPLVLTAAITLAACQGEAPAPATPTATPAEAPAPATAPETGDDAKAARRAVRTSPERIQEIEATGRTGLWSSVAEACSTGKPVRTMLTWNVKASGSERVVVYVIDKKGKETNFGQGGPVGEKETGDWVRGGTQFKLKDRASKQELADLVIGTKSC